MHRDRKAWFEVGTLVRVFRRLGGGATMEIVQACLARQGVLCLLPCIVDGGKGWMDAKTQGIRENRWGRQRVATLQNFSSKLVRRNAPFRIPPYVNTNFSAMPPVYEKLSTLAAESFFFDFFLLIFSSRWYRRYHNVGLVAVPLAYSDPMTRPPFYVLRRHSHKCKHTQI